MTANFKAIFGALRRLAIGGLLTWPIVCASPPTITTPSPLPPGTVGVPYSQTMLATGGVSPYRWGGSGTLPPGLQLAPDSGVLSGTPATPGTFTFTIQVADDLNANSSKAFSLTINAPAVNQI